MFSNAIYKTALRLNVSPKEFSYKYLPYSGNEFYNFTLPNGLSITVLKYAYAPYQLYVNNNPFKLNALNGLANATTFYVGYDYYELAPANATPNYTELNTFNALAKALSILANN